MKEIYAKSKLFWLIVPGLLLSLSQFPLSATSNLESVTVSMKKSHTGQEAQAKNSVNECQFKGHFDEIFSLTFSPDGQTFISVSKDNTSKIWDTSTGELLRTFTGASGSIRFVAIGADNNTMIIGSDDKNIIKLWDSSTGKLLHQFKGHADLVTSVAISPNGQTLVSGSWDKTIKLWELATEKLLHTFTGHSEGVNSVAISPDGQTLVSGSSDKTVKLWDINTGKEIRTLKGHSEIVISLAISPDGQTLVSGSEKIKVWELTTGKEIITLKGHSPMVESLAISSDGSKLVSGAWDSTIKIWELKTLKLLHSLGQPVNLSASLPQNTPNGLLLSFISPSIVTISPNGQTLVSGNRSKIKLWNMPTGQSIKTIAGHSDWIESVIISPDQKTLINISGNPSEIPHSSINLWDVDSGKRPIG